MSISSVSSAFASLRPIAAGVRAQMDAMVLSTALDSMGMLDPEVGAALDSVADAGRSLTEAGVAAAKSDLVGRLLDVLA